MIRRVLCGFLLFAMVVQVNAQSLPARIGQQIAAVVKNKVGLRGFAANDPRYGATVAAVGTAVVEIGTAVAVAGTAPAWGTVLASAAIAGAVGYGLQALSNWLFNKDGTVTIPASGSAPPVAGAGNCFRNAQGGACYNSVSDVLTGGSGAPIGYTNQYGTYTFSLGFVISDLHRTLKVVVELSFRTTKIKSLGLNKVYRVEMWEGWKQHIKSRVKVENKKYDPAIFPLYSSYDGGKGKEITVDDRQNILKNPMLWGLIAALLVLGSLSFWAVGKFFKGPQGKPNAEAKGAVRDATVDCSLSQQVSNFVNTTTGVNNSPTLIKRELKTDVSLADGDVIILGGMTETKDSGGTTGMSFLPAFMRSKTESISKSEIILVLQLTRI